MLSIEELVNYVKYNVWQGPNRSISFQDFILHISKGPDYANDNINLGRLIANIIYEIFQIEKDKESLVVVLGTGLGVIMQLNLPCFLYPDMVEGDEQMTAMFTNYYHIRNGMDE